MTPLREKYFFKDIKKVHDLDEGEGHAIVVQYGRRGTIVLSLTKRDDSPHKDQ